MVTRTEAKAPEVARGRASLASAADALLAGDAAAEALAEAEGATWAEGAGEEAERTNPWVPPAAEALIRGENDAVRPRHRAGGGAGGGEVKEK